MVAPPLPSRDESDQVAGEVKPILTDAFKAFYTKLFVEKVLLNTADAVDTSAQILKQDCKLNCLELLRRFNFFRAFLDASNIPLINLLQLKLVSALSCFAPAVFDFFVLAKKEFPQDACEQNEHMVLLADQLGRVNACVTQCATDFPDDADVLPRLQAISTQLEACRLSVRQSLLRVREARVAKCVAAVRQMLVVEKLQDLLAMAQRSDLKIDELERFFTTTDLFSESGAATKFMFGFWETESADGSAKLLAESLGQDYHPNAAVAEFRHLFAIAAAAQTAGRPLETDESRATLAKVLLEDALEVDQVQRLPPALHHFISKAYPKITPLIVVADAADVDLCAVLDAA